MKKESELAVMPSDEIAEKLQNVVLSVTGKDGLAGFQKAFLMASGIKQLRELLTPEYMAPIMALQGSKLGFRTDKDLNKDRTPGQGYPMEVVKNCVIEAVLNGLQVTGNQFNIIAGNMYPTKEGTGYILNNMKGLNYQIICNLPRTNPEKTSAAVDVVIKWTINGKSEEEIVPIPIKMDAYTSLDAVIGKATRKGRAWLISRITGSEITDGEIEDVKHTVIETKITEAKPTENQVEMDRMMLLINDASSLEELEFYLPSLPTELREYFDKKHAELIAKGGQNG
jgi:hypothetical protein